MKREYISLIGTSDVFKKHLLALVVRNGYGEYDHTIILSDGATWIHNIKEELFPDAQQIPVYFTPKAKLESGQWFSYVEPLVKKVLSH